MMTGSLPSFVSGRNKREPKLIARIFASWALANIAQIRYGRSRSKEARKSHHTSVLKRHMVWKICACIPGLCISCGARATRWRDLLHFSHLFIKESPS